MNKNISDTIVQVCKKLGIKYQSCNPDYTAFHNDAKRIAEIVKEVEDLTYELHCILDRHNIENGIKNLIESDLKKLHEIDHDLIRFAKRIKKE